MTDIKITFKLDEHVSALIVEFEGQLDISNLDHAMMEIESIVNQNSWTTLVFDLGKLTYLNSRSVAFIGDMFNKMAQAQKKFMLCGLVGGVADTLDLVGLTQIIPTFENVEKALNA